MACSTCVLPLPVCLTNRHFTKLFFSSQLGRCNCINMERIFSPMGIGGGMYMRDTCTFALYAFVCYCTNGSFYYNWGNCLQIKLDAITHICLHVS